MRYPILYSILIGLFLTACGFQPRGMNTQLSERFAKTYFTEPSNIDEQFPQQVKHLFQLNGGQLVSKTEATIAVTLSPVTEKSRQMAIANNGTLKEYERNYQVTVTLIDLSNQAQLGSRTLAVTRNIQLDESKVLANEEQSAISLKAAERSLAQSIIRYLESF